jgi:hypothetical protein
MSTIAYREGFLAADSLLVDDRGIISSEYYYRIISEPDFVIAHTGKLSSDVGLIKEWLSGLEGIGVNCIDAPYLDDGDECFWVFSKNGCFNFVYGYGLIELTAINGVSGFSAAGTGRELAMGAMASGASADDAVKAAILLDTKSGGKVQCLNIKEYFSM